MRKLISIPVIILILFSGITVNLAFHYCGGMLAGKNISLSGKPASCGMEGESDHQAGLKSLCCENLFSSYTFNNTYIPSSNFKDVSTDHEFPVQEIFTALIRDITVASFSQEVLARPPGVYSPSDVELISICIFRI